MRIFPDFPEAPGGHCLGATDAVYYERSLNGGDTVTFGQKLRILRETAKLTQAALAEKAQVSLRTVQSWEQDRRSPVSPDFFRLTAALSASCEDFADIADGKKQA